MALFYILINCLQEKFDLQCVTNNSINELMRCIRSQMDSLITGLGDRELSAMALGLAHRYVLESVALIVKFKVEVIALQRGSSMISIKSSGLTNTCGQMIWQTMRASSA